MKIFVLISSLLVLSTSCKKTKTKRLKIGNEKKMIVTGVNKSLEIFNGEALGLVCDLDVDIDNDTQRDFTLTFDFNSGYKPLGVQDYKVPWELFIEVTNPDYFFFTVPNSNLRYRTESTTSGPSEFGVPTLIKEIKISCDPNLGTPAEDGPFQLRTSSLEDDYEQEVNAFMTAQGNRYLLANSKHTFIRAQVGIDEVDASILYTKLTLERNCNVLNKEGAFYLPFKKRVEDGYKLGWIALILTDESCSISNSAISENLVE